MRRASVSSIALILALVVAPGVVSEAAIPAAIEAAGAPAQSGPATGTTRPPFRHMAVEGRDTDGVDDPSTRSNDPYFGLASGCRPDMAPMVADDGMARFRDIVKFVGRQALVAKSDHDDINGTDIYETALDTYIWRIDQALIPLPVATEIGLHTKDLRDRDPRRDEDHLSRGSGQVRFPGGIANDCDPREMGPILASLFDNAGGIDMAPATGRPLAPGPRGGPGPRFPGPSFAPPSFFPPPTGGTPGIDPTPQIEIAPVPLPAGLVLLLSGMGAFAGLSAWRRKAAPNR